MAPIFHVVPLSWQPPPADRFDALLLTSANAPRHAGPALAAYAGLPCYCVGEATAAAARAAGLRDLHVGARDGAALVAMAAADGGRRLLHLAGRDHVGLTLAGGHIERRLVYASEPLDLPTTARDALAAGVLALVHSPRLGARLAALTAQHGLPRARTRVLAISAAAAAAAGTGWAGTHAAAEPHDAALLALAAELCQNGGRAATGPGE